MYITDIVYLLDVLVVIVYISYCNCWGYLLLHEDWGECSEDWAGGVEVGVRGGGGGCNFLTEKKNSAKKCSWGLKTPCKYYFFSEGRGFWGCLGRPTPPPGGRAGSKNNTLLPMTMICDRLKFWSGPAWRSKIIIRKPWQRKNKQNLKKIFC